MEPVTTAALISGGAQLLGGLLGRKKTDNAYNIALQEQSSLRHEKDSFDQKMALAKQHGLHPLSVLGVPMSTFAPAITPEPQNDYSFVGDAVSQMSKGFVKPPEQPATPEADPRADRLLDAQVRTAEATANRSEWDALRAQWTTQDILRGGAGSPPAVRSSNDSTSLATLAARQAGVSAPIFRGGTVDVKQDVTTPHPSLLGHGAGADQSFIRMVDKDGKTFSMPNPNVYQPDIEQFGTFHTLANKYGVDRAMQMMAALEQAPLAGALALGAAGIGTSIYRYFGNQRREALSRNKSYRGGQSWRGRASRGSD